MPPQLDVSVIVPCFNAQETLIRCIQSIVQQTSYPREIIIVDDGSEIPINNMVEELRSTIDVEIKFLSQSNRGAAAARNAALRMATCRYAAFLDADDIWLPDKLEIQYEFMEKYDLRLGAHYYAFDARFLTETGSLSAVKVHQINRMHFVYGNPIFTPTVMVRRNDFSGFDERFRRVDDYKAWIENFQAGRYMMIAAVLAAGFKPPIGHSGLTGSIDAMHLAFIDVLNALRAEHKISRVFYYFARFIEALKLPIRRMSAKYK